MLRSGGEWLQRKAPLCKGSWHHRKAVTEGLSQYVPTFSPNLVRVRNISPHSPPVSFADSPPYTEGPPSETVTPYHSTYCHCLTFPAGGSRPAPTVAGQIIPPSTNLSFYRKSVTGLSSEVTITTVPVRVWDEAPCASNYNLSGRRKKAAVWVIAEHACGSGRCPAFPSCCRESGGPPGSGRRLPSGLQRRR